MGGGREAEEEDAGVAQPLTKCPDEPDTADDVVDEAEEADAADDEAAEDAITIQPAKE